MLNKIAIFAAVSVLTLSACQDRDAAKTQTSAASKTAQTSVSAPDNTNGAFDDSVSQSENRYASWEGKWTGPEGMFVEIAPLEAGQYQLVMQSDLDTKGSYAGMDSEHGIKFMRGDDALTLRKASGDETGLKWLAGKSDCLMVKSGEGYCRD